MLSLEIRFLTGRYAAGRHDDDESPEWPPHPARVYSALTAALHETGNEPADDERAALEWLARAGAPAILAPGMHRRHIGNVFVPVNDPKALDTIDKHLLAVSKAEQEVDATDGKAREKAERRVAQAREKLQERSLATAVGGRSGRPQSAKEVLEHPRHPRFFPVALPAGDVVQMRWADDAPQDVATALDRVCERVCRLGHSSSLVSLRIVDADSEPPVECMRWVPDPEGGNFIRVPHRDQLRHLESVYAIHQATEPRVLPARSARYVRLTGAEEVEGIPASEFAASARDWLVYEVVPAPDERRRHLLDLSLAQQVTRAFRGALLSALDGDAPEAVSGHDADGGPASRTHVALVPLADLGHEHATGSILGVAIVPPRAMEVQDRDRLLEGVFRAGQSDGGGSDERQTGRLRLTLGRHGVLHLQRLRGPSRLRTLDPGRWCSPARRWATATAVALDRNPGHLLSSDPRQAQRAAAAAEHTISKACVHIGLPEPAAVWVHRRSLLEGAPAARRFAPFPDGGNGPRRVCVHAEILFDRRVRGPVLLGAGRYFGLGLAVPYDHGMAEDQR